MGILDSLFPAAQPAPTLDGILAGAQLPPPSTSNGPDVGTLASVSGVAQGDPSMVHQPYVPPQLSDTERMILGIGMAPAMAVYGGLGSAASVAHDVASGSLASDAYSAFGGGAPMPTQDAQADVAGRALGVAGLMGAASAPFERPAGSVNSGLTVYHGSPYDFDAFDMSKIGTGEGAQAYGHGLYFAENEKVAQAYRDALSSNNSELMLNNQGYKYSDLPPNMQSAYDHIQDVGGDIDKALGEAREAIMRGFRSNDQTSVDYWTAHEQVLQSMKDQDYRSGGAGHMYQVNIDSDPQHFLDHDAEWVDQPEYIRNALKKVGIDHDNYVPQYADPDPRDMFGLRRQINRSPTGGSIYQQLSEWGGQGMSGAQMAETRPTRDAAAAEFLRQAGIPGIKYFDAASRGEGAGTRNYVVFDDKTLSIMRKYGLAGVLGAGGALGASFVPSGSAPAEAAPAH